MPPRSLEIVVAGLTVTSSWGNGHATTYRALLGALAARGHRITFLERDVPWYASNRDREHAAGCDVMLYKSLEDLSVRFTSLVRDADVAIVGSYVPEGIAVGDWVLSSARGLTAFYDIDTPVTLAALERGDAEYLAVRQIPKYGLYLSFTGGPTLRRLEETFGAPAARALYCSFDPKSYFPETVPERWLMGYMGTYSADRQPVLERLMLAAARRMTSERFCVAGPLYPKTLAWPANVERIEHLAPGEHRSFYCAQRYTLNVTRADMVRAGFSPSVRLFEAAACATPIVSDVWPGLDELFDPGREILLARGTEEVRSIIERMQDAERRAIGERARRRVLAQHTAEHRAIELETSIAERMGHAAGRRTRRTSGRTRAAPPDNAQG